jgi:hypothetical protein
MSSTPTRGTWKTHGRPTAGTFYRGSKVNGPSDETGTFVTVQVETGMVTFRDYYTDSLVAQQGVAGRFWFTPQTTVKEAAEVATAPADLTDDEDATRDAIDAQVQAEADEDEELLDCGCPADADAPAHPGCEIHNAFSEAEAAEVVAEIAQLGELGAELAKAMVAPKPEPKPEAKPAPAAKPQALNREQKAALAGALFSKAGDLVEFWNELAAEDPELDGIDATTAAQQLANWLKYLPTKGWDDRLPRP